MNDVNAIGSIDVLRFSVKSSFKNYHPDFICTSISFTGISQSLHKFIKEIERFWNCTYLSGWQSTKFSYSFVHIIPGTLNT